MKRFLKNKKLLIIISLIILFVLNFVNGFLSNENIGIYTFEKFESDSEKLVLNKLEYDSLLKETGDCKYGLCYYKDGKFSSYESQVGLQGYVVSFMYNNLNISLNDIRTVFCFFLSIILVFISYTIFIKYSITLGIIFGITFLFSPWIVAFAKNLYWVPFTWFLPCLLGLILSVDYKRKKTIIPLIFISILIKCLCGYEYITTICLCTIMFFVVDIFNSKNNKKEVFKTIVYVGISCLLGFLISLFIHSYVRGDGDILDGISTIYNNDVLRRTIIMTDKDSYTGIYRQSMDAKVMDVIEIYFLDWKTDIIYGINSNLFPILALVAFVGCLLSLLKKDKFCVRDLVMYLITLLSTISWFILAKPHSYCHSHMNFVLWYFGFVQVVFYLNIKLFIKIQKLLIKMKNI